MSTYIFTSVHEGIDNSYTQLLSLIAAHPSFKSKVNTFLQLFPSSISSQDFIKLGELIYTVLLPDFPHNLRRKLATELLSSLQTHSDTITYTNLSEFLLKICSDAVENVDVRSAIGFLDMVQSRIVDHFIVDVEDPNFKRKIETNVKLEIFDPEAIITDTEMPERKHRVAGELIYYEEKFSLA